MIDQFGEENQRPKKEKKHLSRAKELELILKVTCGDKDSFGELYRHFIMALRGFIAGRIGNIEDAKDVAQDCFIVAEKRVRECKYNPEYRFFTLLSTIAKRLIINYWGRMAKKLDIDIEEKEEEKKERRRKKEEKREKTVYRRREIPFAELADPSEEGKALELVDIILRTPPEQIDEIVRLELLRVVFLCCAKPHQVLAFGFIKLLEWRPREVADELSDWTLGKLGEKFCEDCYAVWGFFLDRQKFDEYVSSSLHEKLDRLVEEVYREHPYGRVRKEFPGALVKDLPLGTFYGGREPSADLSDWVWDVGVRTRNVVEGGSLRTEGCNSGGNENESS